MTREEKEATLRLHGWYPVVTRNSNCGWVKDGRMGFFMAHKTSNLFTQNPPHDQKHRMDMCPMVDRDFETIWFKITHSLAGI